MIYNLCCCALYTKRNRFKHKSWVLKVNPAVFVNLPFEFVFTAPNSIPSSFKIRWFFYKHGLILFTFRPLIKIFRPGSVSPKDVKYDSLNTDLYISKHFKIHFNSLRSCFCLGCYDDFDLRFQNLNNYTCTRLEYMKHILVSITFEKINRLSLEPKKNFVVIIPHWYLNYKLFRMYGAFVCFLWRFTWNQ